MRQRRKNICNGPARIARGHSWVAGRGFTLIEFLVALGVFAIIISVAVGGFVRALRIQRQLISLVSVNGNMSLALEQMAREIRTGRTFTSPQDSILNFQNARHQSVTYCLDSTGSLRRGVGGGSCESNAFQKITAENVKVSDLKFALLNNPRFPARVTISLGVTPKEIGVDTSVVYLQTTVSARNLE